MKTEVAESLSKDIKIRPSIFLRKHSENRLRMNIPYMGQWANALALMSSPENMAKSCNYGLTLVDTMWYNAGDKSLDYNWYSKRLLLLGKYYLLFLFYCRNFSRSKKHILHVPHRINGVLLC